MVESTGETDDRPKAGPVRDVSLLTLNLQITLCVIGVGKSHRTIFHHSHHQHVAGNGFFVVQAEWFFVGGDHAIVNLVHFSLAMAGVYEKQAVPE